MRKLKRLKRVKVNNKYFVLGILLIFSLILVSAEVGLGISPSKMKEQVVAGDTYTYSFLVFNTGSQDIEVSLVVDGEIAEFATVQTPLLTISPEPSPHEFPIKNGVSFNVVFEMPKSMGDKAYTGTVSAVGKAASGSQFGGSVAVSSQVEFVSLSPDSIFSKLETKYYFIILGFIVLILLIYLLKRAGFHMEFSSNNKKGSNKKNQRKK